MTHFGWNEGQQGAIEGWKVRQGLDIIGKAVGLHWKAGDLGEAAVIRLRQQAVKRVGEKCLNLHGQESFK